LAGTIFDLTGSYQLFVIIAAAISNCRRTDRLARRLFQAWA